jgi:hypothetical protein
MMPRPPESAIGTALLLTALFFGAVLVTEAFVKLLR